MFNSFSAALSALKAHSAAVDAVGHNLANVNTTGFKAGSVSFKDLVAESVSGGRSETGFGVAPAISTRNFSQGAIQSSGGPLDAAIQGNGFFVVKNAQGSKLLTRDGSFQLDSAGYVVTSTGERVQQYTNGVLSDIKMPAGAIASTPTSTLSMIANLDAGAKINDTFSTPVEVVDSLGNQQLVKFDFKKTAANSWDVTVVSTAGTVVQPSPSTFTFDNTGKMTAPAAPGLLNFKITGLTSNAADLSIDWSVYDTNGAPTFTQFARTSAVSKNDQNGYPAAEVASVAMANGGKIVAKYSNGQEREVGALAIALVANPASLTSASNNNYRVSNDSAAPVYGTAESGGRGKVAAGALEGSTVDLAREFTNLIVYQRGYQANSRVITTTDEISQETLNLKR